MRTGVVVPVPAVERPDAVALRTAAQVRQALGAVAADLPAEPSALAAALGALASAFRRVVRLWWAGADLV